MLVWIASFPRSGNTLLRIALYRRYGIRTSVIYDVDGVAERVGADLVGYTDRPAPLEMMRASSDLHMIKTHRQRDTDVDESDAAICLVRDGRDALVSWARQASEAEPGRYEDELRARIIRRAAIGTGSWGANVLSWLTPPVPHRPVLRYEDLAADPVAAVERVVAVVAPHLAPRSGAVIPSLDELRRTDDRFFRRGHTGTHRDEMPEDLHRLFWAHPDNVAAMRLLGYDDRSAV
ncbi:sulfotransferase domain-containing protein [Dactylosporangium sp. NPDC050688]|uniref:sulfotransferase domain-containing protein n=1 Tax=Dactylosporangium sp. NPDC050688 TaxID=3157217 RepID=UPI0033CE7A63